MYSDLSSQLPIVLDYDLKDLTNLGGKKKLSIYPQGILIWQKSNFSKLSST